MTALRLFQWFFLIFGLIAAFLLFFNGFGYSDRAPASFSNDVLGTLSWILLAIGFFMLDRGPFENILGLVLLLGGAVAAYGNYQAFAH